MKKPQTITRSTPRLYFSNADSWRNCPGSLDFEDGRNIFGDDAMAKKGTEFHAFIEFILSFATSSKQKRIFSYENSVSAFQADQGPVTEEFVIWGELVYNRIKWDLEEFGGKLLLEQPLEYSVPSFDLVGRADGILVSKDHVHIYDWKTGFNEVSAKGNEQLRATAHVYKAQDKESLKPKQYIGVIIQPPLKTIDQAEIVISEDYFDEIAKLVKGERKLRVGKQCTYCLHASGCPEFLANLEKLRNPKYQDQAFNRPEEIAKILEIAKPIRKALENIESLALSMAKNNISIPGWGLATKNAHRSWNHNMTPQSLAAWLNLKKKDVIEESVLSPAGVEKKLKSDTQKQRFSEIVLQKSYPYLKQNANADLFDRSYPIPGEFVDSMKHKAYEQSEKMGLKPEKKSNKIELAPVFLSGGSGGQPIGGGVTYTKSVEFGGMQAGKTTKAKTESNKIKPKKGALHK